MRGEPAATEKVLVYDGKPVTTPLELAVPTQGRPMYIELGSLRLNLVDRGGRLP